MRCPRIALSTEYELSSKEREESAWQLWSESAGEEVIGNESRVIISIINLLGICCLGDVG
jgi:hypothetical protein